VAGKANWNIFTMARKGLREALQSAFRKAMQNFDAVIFRNMNLGTDGGTQFVDIIVQRIESPDSIRGMVMVVFTDVPAKLEYDAVNPKTGKLRQTKRQKELEIKLQQSDEDICSIREEMQSSQEELKSTNEELQSANEELLTSKEELQSLNEELMTVNIELQSKVNDFVRAHNDMKNLLNCTEIATLFLDKNLNIRRFTDKLIDIYKIRSSDIGRPITDLAAEFQYPEIWKDALHVITTLISMNTEIATLDGKWFIIKIMPYRTLDDFIDGVVVTFIDITLAKILEQELKKANELLSFSEIRYRRVFEMGEEGLLILDAETGKILDVNTYLIEMLEY